jgi:cytochrome P450
MNPATRKESQVTLADAELPAFPFPRADPLDPAPSVIAVQDGERVTRVRLWNGSTPWLVTGYDEARAILSDPRVSSDTDKPGYPHVSEGQVRRRQVAKSFLNMDNPRHDQLRRSLTASFMIKRIEALRPSIQAIVDDLIDDLLAGPNPADLVEAFALPVPSLVICALLGVPVEERPRFNKLTATMLSASATPDETAGALNEMLGFFDSLIDLKDATPADDVISRLVVEQLRPGLMSRDELVKICQLLLNAGHETTSNMIALGTLALLRHPDVLEEIRSTDDPAVIANAVDEMLRFLTVLHNGRRRVALDDIDLGGVKIKAGEGIIVSLEAADRDASAFPDPDTIDIHRKARHHLGFGYGIHQCLGQPLARVELQVVYPTIARRIPTLRLAVDIDQIPFKDTSIIYGAHHLPVTW